MLATWVSTVRSEMNRRAAVSPFEAPSATRRATSSSRRDSGPPAPRGGWPRLGGRARQRRTRSPRRASGRARARTPRRRPPHPSAARTAAAAARRPRASARPDGAPGDRPARSSRRPRATSPRDPTAARRCDQPSSSSEWRTPTPSPRSRRRARLAGQALRLGGSPRAQPDVPDEVQDVGAKPRLAELLTQRNGSLRERSDAPSTSPARELGARERCTARRASRSGMSIAGREPERLGGDRVGVVPATARTRAGGSEPAATTPTISASPSRRPSSSASCAIRPPSQIALNRVRGMQRPRARSPGRGSRRGRARSATRAGGRSPRPALRNARTPRGRGRSTTPERGIVRARSAELERGPDVGPIGADPGEQLRLARVVGADVRGERRRPMSRDGGRRSSAVPDAWSRSRRELAEHARGSGTAPGPARSRAPRATLDERRRASPGIASAGSSSSAHTRLRRVELEAAGEHRQPLPQQPLGLAQQLVAPVDRALERLLSRRRAPVARAEATAEPSRPRARASSPSVRARTAASSSASGMPSSRRHSSTISGRSGVEGHVPTIAAGCTRRRAARSRNSATASDRARPGRAVAGPRGATAAARRSPPRRRSRAPAGWWPGSAGRDRPAAAFPRATPRARATCSQLSRIRSRRWPAR